MPEWKTEKRYSEDYTFIIEERTQYSPWGRILQREVLKHPALGPWETLFLNHENKIACYLNPKSASSSIKEMLKIPSLMSWLEKNPQDAVKNLKYLTTLKWEYWKSQEARMNAERAPSLQLKPSGTRASDAPPITGERSFRNYFKFGFVRNPYDRLFSAYKMFRAFDSDPMETASKGALVFDSFVEQVYTNTFKDNHIKNQSFFLPKHHNVDFVGRFENFENDWKRLENEIGICFVEEVINRQPLSLGRNNASFKESQKLSRAMTQETANKIYEFYKEDFDNFGYDKDDYAGITIV
tara:strand:- start:20025 stop:20912 length:888 start_codon:yes stop_codon:yes gene_type:complete